MPTLEIDVTEEQLAGLKEYLRRDRFEHGGEQNCACSSCMAADEILTRLGQDLEVFEEGFPVVLDERDDRGDGGAS